MTPAITFPSATPLRSPMIAALVPITGLTATSALIALVSYTLLILVRNIVTGIDGVPEDARDAADGMGFTRGGRLWRVDLPLATPVIVAGLRIATVTTIGLVTVSALIGQGGLGRLIVDGLRRSFPTMTITGAVLSVLLAVVADIAFVAAVCRSCACVTVEKFTFTGPSMTVCV